MSPKLPPLPAPASPAAVRSHEQACAALSRHLPPGPLWSLPMFRNTVARVEALVAAEIAPDVVLAAALLAMRGAHWNIDLWSQDGEARHKVGQALVGLLHRLLPTMAPKARRTFPAAVLKQINDGRTLLLPVLATAMGPYLDAAARRNFDRLLRTRADGVSPMLRDDFLRARQAIAQARGDADLYLALEDRLCARDPVRASLVLMAAGRPTEARDHLATWPSLEPRFMSLAAELQVPRRSLVWAEIHEALGDGEAAQSIRWSTFTRALSFTALRAFLARVPEVESTGIEERAIAWAMGFPEAGRCVRFLLDMGRMAEAAQRVLQEPDRWNSVDGWGAREAAHELRSRFPLAATVLLRGRIRQIVLEGAQEHRKEARFDLVALERLAPTVEAGGELPPGFRSHAQFVAYVQDLCCWNDRPQFLGTVATDRHAA